MRRSSTREASWRLRLRDFARCKLTLTAPVLVKPGAAAATTTLLFVHAGEISLRLPAPDVPVRLHAGDVALIARGTSWELAAPEEVGPEHAVEIVLGTASAVHDGAVVAADRVVLGVVSLVFEDEATSALLQQLPTSLIARAAVHGVSGFAAMLEGLERRDPGFLDDAAIGARALEILVLSFLESSPAAAGGHQPPPSPAVCKAVELMRTNLQDRWRVGALASRVGLSRSSFAARFTSEVGEPPLRHLARLRLREAAVQLARTQAPLKWIASEVGYDSLPSFCKAFRQHFGVTPGAYRAQTMFPPRSPARPACIR